MQNNFKISNKVANDFNKIIRHFDSVNDGNNSIGASNDIDAIKTWLNEFRDSPNTLISYRQTVERFLLWCIANNRNLKSITRDDIQIFSEFLQNPIPQEIWCGQSRPRGHKDWRPFVRGLKATSIKLNLQILTALYKYLVDSGYLLNNPFSLVRRKSANIVKGVGVERFLTHKEWEYVLDYICNKLPQLTYSQKIYYHRIRWVFILLYLTGCRRSEIANARMSDFVYKRNQWWLRVVGKGNKYGEIPVTNELLNELILYRNSIGLSNFPSSSETDIGVVNELWKNIAKLNQLPVNPKYKPISDSMLYKLIKTTCNTISEEVKDVDPSSAFVISRVSTHWLRHTSATHQVDAGVDIRVVKENLRHSMLETTMKYQHAEADARHTETEQKFSLNNVKNDNNK